MSLVKVNSITDLNGDPVLGGFTFTTPQSTGSGTSVLFNGIPSTAKVILLITDNVSLSGTDYLNISLGDSGGLEATGYESRNLYVSSGGSTFTNFISTGFRIGTDNVAASGHYGIYTFTNITNNSWVLAGNGHVGTWTDVCSGEKTLSAVLTQIELKPSGANTFDGGQVGLAYQ